MDNLAQVRDGCWTAAAVAEVDGDATALGLAALGLGGLRVHEHRSSLEQARVDALQRRALATLAPDDALAMRLRTRLAAEQSFLERDPTAVLASLDAARRMGDPVVVAEALSLAHHCLLGPQHGHERIGLAEELIRVSAHTARPIDALMGLAWRTVDLLLAGDRRAMRSLGELHACLAHDRCAALEYVVRAVDVMVATRQGRLADAERMAATAFELGVEVGDADALGWYGAHLVALRWLQGRADELVPMIREMVDSTSVAEPAAGFVAALAAVGAAAGDRTTASAALACLRAPGLHTLPTSCSWMATMLGVCEAAHLLGDSDAAAEAYGLLAPYADLPVMASLAVASFGSAHRPLGLAARTMGDLDRAVDHLERAGRAELATGDRPWHTVSDGHAGRDSRRTWRSRRSVTRRRAPGRCGGGRRRPRDGTPSVAVAPTVSRAGPAVSARSD